MTPHAEESHCFDDGVTRISVEKKTLILRHTWTTAMSSSPTRETIHVRYTRDGLTGFGEGAPIVRYAETPDAALHALSEVLAIVAAGDPMQFTPLLARLRGLLGPRQKAALAAIELALCDWLGKRFGIPLHAWFGLDPLAAPVTSFSIGIDDPAVVKAKTAEASGYAILKVKVGLSTDEEMIQAVRSVTDKPIRVDANEAWTDVDEAIRKINWLETQGAELIEQPMPAPMLDETQYVRGKVHLPIIADEACTALTAIPRLREAYDGINVKLDKSGGMMEAHRWITAARAVEMKVMLGCMISSSCTCTAAAQLAPLVDFLDLDGYLLIANDPYVGVLVEQGRPVLPRRPGLGVLLREDMDSAGLRLRPDGARKPFEPAPPLDITPLP